MSFPHHHTSYQPELHATVFRRRAFFLFLVIVSIISRSEAQHLSVRLFTPDDGIPSEACFPMLQDSYGFMWFASEQGPIAFDGASFTVFSRSEHIASDVVAGVEDAQGDMWVGGINGFYHGIRSKVFPLQFDWEPLRDSSGVAIRWVSDVELSPQHEIFFVDSGNIFQWSDAKPVRSVFLGPDGSRFNPEGVHDLQFDRKGRMLFFSRDDLYRSEGPTGSRIPSPIRLHHLQLPQGEAGFGTVTIDSVGRVLFRQGLHGLVVLDTNDQLTPFENVPGFGENIVDLKAGKGSDLWVGGDFMLSHYNVVGGADGPVKVVELAQIRSANGLPVGGPMTGIYLDRDDNIWTHQTYTGPSHINLKGFTLYGRELYHGEDPQKTLLADSSCILISGMNNYLIRFGKRVYGSTSFRTVDHVEAFASGAKHGAIPLNWGRDSLMLGFHADVFSMLVNPPAGKAMLAELHFKFAPGVAPFKMKDVYDVQSMYRDRDGNLYVGENYLGVLKCRLVRDTVLVEKVFTYDLGGGFRSTRAITQMRDGSLWFGGFFDGLTVVTGDSIHSYTIADGLTDNAIRSLMEDRTGSLWIGTRRGGLTLWRDGKFTEPQFLNRPTNTIWCLRELSDGSIWAGTDEGLISLSPGQTPGTAFRIRYFNAVDGLPRQRVISINSDERQLYVTAIGGLYVADRAFLASSTGMNLRPYFKSLRVNGIEQSSPRLELPAGDHTISISFGVVDQVSTGSLFYQYRINAPEGAWSNPVSQTELTFAGLSPGLYRFELRTADVNRGISRTSDSAVGNVANLAFTIATPFYRTSAAYVLIGILLLGAGGVAYQIRVQQILRIERIRAEENERLRRKVAADFHDEFGHRLAKINLFSEILKTKQITPELRDYLDRIITNAQGTYNGVRDFLWTLDPENDTVGEVAIRLKKFGDELFEKTNVAFRLQPPPVALENLRLSMDWRRHLILIFQEALTNTLKHSGARHVDLFVQDRGNGSFEIVLRDDGIGLTDSKRNEGIGLRSMQTRATAVGGTVTIQNGDEGGTIVRFTSKTP